MDRVDAVGETLPSSCPPPEQLVELASGRLDAQRVGAVEQHIDLCAECRVALASLARGGQPTWQLGRYVIDRVLGSGGMGIVYLAHDPALGREVAIKVVRSDPDGSLRARLEREAKALARLSHPNVCHVYDVGTDGEELWIAMELIRGTTMRDWLGSRPSLREVMDILGGVARGLEAAHTAGMVHRDVKPENVLVERGGRPVVSDFGLAQVMDGTRSSALAGTPAYMAPEQLDGQPADARSDQYAFAVMAHEALAGARPRPRDVASATLAPGIRAVLERALSDDPAARYPSVSALVEALAAAVAASGMAMESRPVAPGPGGLAIGSAPPLAQGSGAPAAAPVAVVATAARRSGRGALLGGLAFAAIALAAVGGWWFARRGAPAPSSSAPAGAPIAAMPAPPSAPAKPLEPSPLARDAGVPVEAPLDAAAVATMPAPPAHAPPTHAPPTHVPSHVTQAPHPTVASASPVPTGAHDPGTLLQLAMNRIQAGDGPGCLAAFATYDKEGGLTGAVAVSANTSRAMCQMVAGQCDAGRKAIVALQEAQNITHDQASSYADALISMYCKAPKTDRDRLLRAIRVLDDRTFKHTVAECREAYKAGIALAPSYEPISPSDMARDAMRRVRNDAPACFARAGDCPEAWAVAKQIDLASPLVPPQSTELSRRQTFQMSVGGTCYDESQGTLTDSEILYREAAELSGAREAKKVTLAWCTTRMDRARKAFANAGTRELAYELTGYSAACLADAGDCTAAWVPYASFARALGESDDQTRELFKAHRCGIPGTP
jgi:serine/threonine-protein kinase